MKLQTLSAMSLVFALALGGAACKKKTDVGGGAAGSGMDPMATMKAVNEFMKTNGGEPQSISCPPGVEAKAGATFDCVGKMPDGRDVTVTATMTDAAGAMTFKVTKLDPAGGSAGSAGSAAPAMGSGSAAAPDGSAAGSGSAK
jgi:hypothetical protein